MKNNSTADLSAVHTFLFDFLRPLACAGVTCMTNSWNECIDNWEVNVFSVILIIFDILLAKN